MSLKKLGAYALASIMILQMATPAYATGVSENESCYELQVDALDVTEESEEGNYSEESDVSEGEVNDEDDSKDIYDLFNEIDTSSNEPSLVNPADKNIIDKIEDIELETEKVDDPEIIRRSVYMLSNIMVESVGASGYDIINGADCISCESGDFLGLRDGVYRLKDGIKEKISDDIASNFNTSGNVVFYTTVNNGVQYVKGIDSDSLEVVYELELKDYSIKHLYVINNQYFYFLSQGDLFILEMNNKEVKRVTSRGDIFSFIPTTEGVIYATGELFDYDVFFGRIKILDSVSDWFTTEYGIVYRTNEAIEKQIKYVDIKTISTSKNSIDGAESEAIAEVLTLSTDGDDRWIEISADQFLEEVRKVDESYATGNYLAVTDYSTTALTRDEAIGNNAVTNAEQKEIVAKADFIYGGDEGYTIKGDILGYTEAGHGLNKITQKVIDPETGESVDRVIHGILYGMPSIGGVYVECQWDPVDHTLLCSLEQYKSYIEDEKSVLYTAKSLSDMAYRKREGVILDYSPVFSLDCSGFVTYCYGYQSKFGTSTIANSPDSFKYIGGTDLKGLQVGDALNWAGSHVVLVTAIKYDAMGKICFIEITEQTPSWTTRTSYETIGQLQSERLHNKYSVYRKASHSGVLPSISQTSATMHEGDTLSLRVTSDGPMPIADVTWSSSNELVANVDRTGRVTAYASGTAVITATIGKDESEMKVSCTVNVLATSVSISPQSLVLYYNVAGYNTAKLSASSSSGKAVSWRTGSNSPVDVDQNGNVTAKKLGNGTVTAYVGNHEASCAVSVVGPSISISSPSKTVNPGATFTLTATATPATNVVWSSSNQNLASVSGGKVTIASNNYGSCVITARANGVSASCNVKVNPTISLNSGSATIYINDSYTFKATARPNSNVTWNSSDRNVAAVSNGVVTGKGVGTCTITATANGVSTTATVTVKAKTLTISPQNVTVYVGRSASVTATATPSSTISWYSSNSSVASVSGGTITGKSPGTCTITAMANGLSKSCSVTVKDTSLKLNANVITLSKGGGYTLVATAMPTTTITWSSSNSTIASVSNGRVTARKAGTCIITAKAHGKSVTCKVTVR